MWFDGSCLPTNPGKETIGAVIVKDQNGTIVYKNSLREDHESITSSNYAEYVGLELGIDWLISNKDKVSKVNVFGDSNMVIFQAQGKWKIKEGRYYTHKARTVYKKTYENSLNDCLEFNWIPREENHEADELTK